MTPRLVNDNIQTVKDPAENVDVVDSSGATPDINFTAGPFVTRCNPTAK